MFNFTRSQLFVIICITVFWLTACSSGSKQTVSPPPVENVPPPPPPKPAKPANEAQVKSLLIRTLESFPVQVNVIVTGDLPDSCTTLDQFLQDRLGDTFILQILTKRITNQACSQVVQPFVQVIPLDLDDLKAGIYTVKINGVTETFELGLDNVRRR
jgi:hypothetical protein